MKMKFLDLLRAALFLLGHDSFIKIRSALKTFMVMTGEISSDDDDNQ